MMKTAHAVLVSVALAASSVTAASFDLAPVADTYVESGLDAGFDHGVSRALHVDGVPRAVSYLAFDLSGVTAPVVRATLILYVTNTSRDGGSVYAIPTSDWVEGTADGAVGPGLTWWDVDRNGDGVLDASDGSLLVPDPARAVAAIGAVTAKYTIELDVTGAFVAGPGVYTIAIASENSDGTGFKSRDASAGGPVLRVLTEDAAPPSPDDVPPPDPVPAPLPPAVCGDGQLDPGEACDGTADAACPGLCGADCTCGVPPPVPAVELACLEQTGPLVTLGAAIIRYSNRSLLADTRIDGRGVVLPSSPTNFYPFSIAGGDGICAAGVRVAGEYDRTLGWQAMHDLNNAGVTFTDAATIVDGARIDNVEDGIRPREGAEGFVVRGTHLSYVRDDCVENDHLHGGVVTDSFFDGCYVAFSARPGSTDTVSDGRAQVWRVEDSLVRLEPMPGARSGSIAYPDGYGHGPFFKWDQWDDPASSRSPKIALRNDVFRADRITQEGARRMGIPPGQLVECENNVMVWLGPGSYPAPLPACFTVTTDPAVWDAAVTDWKRRHPSAAD